jgi:hypothetical protein
MRRATVVEDDEEIVSLEHRLQSKPGGGCVGRNATATDKTYRASARLTDSTLLHERKIDQSHKMTVFGRWLCQKIQH